MMSDASYLHVYIHHALVQCILMLSVYVFLFLYCYMCIHVYLSCLHNIFIASSDTMVKPNEAF